MTILEVMTRYFKGFFKPASSWAAWTTVLKGIFALPMEDGEIEVFRGLSGRQAPPARPVKEAWLVIGRRGGKSRIAALIATYLAFFKDHSAVLSPGERGVIMVIAADRATAKVVFRFITAFIEGDRRLAGLIERKTAEEIDLSNGISIEVRTASFRTVRGRTVLCCICDEIAYWRDETTANPDVEIVNAIRPAMATIPHSMLIAISSPYARRGLLWEMNRTYHGKDDDEVLVLQADTRTMNPSVPQSVIDRAYRDDEAVAAAEYGAIFRSDLEAFVSRDAVDAVIIPGRFELPPLGHIPYCGFVDPSGGSADSFTLAVSHFEKDKRVLDLVRERRPPFSPEAVVEEYAALLKAYRCSFVTGDRYAGEWPREQFRKHGIDYRPSERTKSELYLELLAPLNSGRVELLDHEKLLSQLCRLERRTSRSGKDSVDHGPGAHDDLINAAAGALVGARVATKIDWDLVTADTGHRSLGESDVFLGFQSLHDWDPFE